MVTVYTTQSIEVFNSNVSPFSLPGGITFDAKPGDIIIFTGVADTPQFKMINEIVDLLYSIATNSYTAPAPYQIAQIEAFGGRVRTVSYPIGTIITTIGSFMTPDGDVKNVGLVSIVDTPTTAILSTSPENIEAVTGATPEEIDSKLAKETNIKTEVPGESPAVPVPGLPPIAPGVDSNTLLLLIAAAAGAYVLFEFLRRRR